MTTRTILLCIALAAFLVVGCLDDGDADEWTEWQDDVNTRQRQPGQPGPETPTVTPPAEVAER